MSRSSQTSLFEHPNDVWRVNVHDVPQHVFSHVLLPPLSLSGATPFSAPYPPTRSLQERNVRYLGRAVAQLVEALRYKPQGRRFDSRLCHWNFSLTMALGLTQPLTEMSTTNISWV